MRLKDAPSLYENLRYEFFHWAEIPPAPLASVAVSVSAQVALHNLLRERSIPQTSGPYYDGVCLAPSPPAGIVKLFV